MAPSSRTVQKAEAKFGVTADYPDLQLHSAAANGNVGLVKYALMHGQPVNSVLNGVLPIHIAAASGNEMVVQMLIDAGADVNAARLPRKYNTDRSKATSSIGAAGSTPLHFAAANGHSNVISLLLTHGANPDLREKHGLRPEDLAREAGHVNVVTVLKIWKGLDATETYAHDDKSDTASIAPSIRSTRDSPSRRLHSASTSSSIKDLRPAAAVRAAAAFAGSSAGGSNSSARNNLLSKPSLDSIASKGKKLVKAASNPNLAGLLTGQAGHSASASNQQALPHFPNSFAMLPTSLRQNPVSKLATSTSFNLGARSPQASQQGNGTPHLHHVINNEKGRRPSLPSVFEKAAHPSHSIRTALGMTPTAGSFGLHRSNSASRKDNDPYHITGRPKRSASRTSLSSVFRPGKDRGDPVSQPLSPAASSFFTGDDELEQAERDAFLRSMESRDVSSGDETYLQHHYGPYRQTQDGRQRPLGRTASSEGFPGRSRAGSGSSAATTGSARSQSVRGYNKSTSPRLNHPVTAPPTQSQFFLGDATRSSSDLSRSHSRQHVSPNSSSASIVIPAPIPPPPSTSNQPFFTKAAITAAHNNPTIKRPGFYRPRKSSQLSTTSSSAAGNGTFLHSPDTESIHSIHQGHPYEEQIYDDDEAENQDALSPVPPPAVVIRRPTIQETYGPASVLNRNSRMPNSPRSPVLDGATTSPVRPSTATGSSRVPSGFSQGSSRHSRASSDGTGTIRTSLSGIGLPDVLENAAFDSRNRSQSAGETPSSGSAYEQRNEQGNEEADQEVDPETARESQDTFPTDQERPFMTRSRAGSRARIDNVPSPLPYSSGNNLHNLISSPTSTSTAQSTLANAHNQLSHDAESSWATLTRPSRSGSTTTDTRTSRSGSTGEGTGQAPRFAGFDYSSSSASTSSFHYQPSQSTTATSLRSSPPHLNFSAPATSEGEVTVTHAQAQSMVKRKEEELLQYDPNSPNSSELGIRGPTLSQQLAAYGESLSIEKELSDAEKHRRHPDQPITLTIPEPQSAKYSWEILGKETRTTMPITKGQRAKDDISKGPVQKLWTHKMVSPFEVPLNRPAGSGTSHKHTSSTGTANAITVSGKPLTRVASHEPPAKTPIPTVPEPVTSQNIHIGHTQTRDQVKDNALRSKSSTLSGNSFLAPPVASGSSDLSIHRRSPRAGSSVSPARSPRSSVDRERLPSTTYHVVAGPGSEPSDSAGSSLVSEPRSTLKPYSLSPNLGLSSSATSKHRHSRSDPSNRLLSHSPETTFVQEETPRQPQILRLETVIAPKFYSETKAGGLAAPSPTKSKFSSKIGKLFK